MARVQKQEAHWATAKASLANLDTLQVVKAIPHCLKLSADQWWGNISASSKKDNLQDLDCWERELSRAFIPNWKQLQLAAKARVWNASGESTTTSALHKISLRDLAYSTLRRRTRRSSPLLSPASHLDLRC